MQIPISKKLLQFSLLGLGFLFGGLFVTINILENANMYIYPLMKLRIRPEVLTLSLTALSFVVFFMLSFRKKMSYLLSSLMILIPIVFMSAWPLEKETFGESVSPEQTNTIIIRQHTSLIDGEYDVYKKRGLLIQKLDYFLVCDGGCSANVISVVWMDEITVVIVYYNGDGNLTSEATITVPND